MSVTLEVLNLGVNLECVATPKFNTTIAVNGAGVEQRNQNWVYPLVEFTLGGLTLNRAQLEYVNGFFQKHRGRSRPFLWKNWQDWKAKDQAIASGDGVKTVFQLVKTYGGSNPLIVPITRPKLSTLTLTVAGTVSTAWTIDLNTGKITFTSAPTGAIVATYFEFYFPVHSNVDSISNRFKALRREDGAVIYELDNSIILEQIRE
jgi:uncharacterized protein (TIGR02217 family)